MLKSRFALLILAGFATGAIAEDVTRRKDVGPMIAAKCGTCHGASGPENNDWSLMPEDKRRSVVPRMDTFARFMTYFVWPATCAMQRRLDDGKAADGKPGNMYQFLGASDQEGAKHLTLLKAGGGRASASRLDRIRDHGWHRCLEVVSVLVHDCRLSERSTRIASLALLLPEWFSRSVAEPLRCAYTMSLSTSNSG